MKNVREITPKIRDREPLSRSLRPWARMEDLFDGLFSGALWDLEPLARKRPMFEMERSFANLPSVDMIDRGDHLFVRAEFPGVRKEDLEISIAGEQLIIEAKREFTEEHKEDTFYRNEMACGRFGRTIYLPVQIRADEVEAALVDGILEIRLPKVEAVKPHHIKVA